MERVFPIPHFPRHLTVKEKEKNEINERIEKIEGQLEKIMASLKDDEAVEKKTLTVAVSQEPKSKLERVSETLEKIKQRQLSLKLPKKIEL